MLAFTPDVSEALDLFQLTHQLQVGFGAAQWARVALPHRGAVVDQDARLMDALEVIRDVMNAAASETTTDDGARSELESFRKENGRNGT